MPIDHKVAGDPDAGSVRVAEGWLRAADGFLTHRRPSPGDEAVPATLDFKSPLPMRIYRRIGSAIRVRQQDDCRDCQHAGRYKCVSAGTRAGECRNSERRHQIAFAVRWQHSALEPISVEVGVMRQLRPYMVSAICGLLIAVAATFWFRDRPPAEIPAVRPIAITAATASSTPVVEPILESQVAFDMVRATGGTVLVSNAGQVQAIVLTGSRVSDSDLRLLNGTPDLILLNLDGTAISDEGLTHIRDLPKLKTLRLCRTAITDAGLSRLSGLPSLESLHLDETRITDEGLRQIGDFPSLNSINALGCPVSNRAESIVRERMPGCRVKH